MSSVKRPRTEHNTPPDPEEISRQLSELRHPALRRIVQAAVIALPSVAEAITKEYNSQLAADEIAEYKRMEVEFDEHLETAENLMNRDYNTLSPRQQHNLSWKVASEIREMFVEMCLHAEEPSSYKTKRNAVFTMCAVMGTIVDAEESVLVDMVGDQMSENGCGMMLHRTVGKLSSTDLERLCDEEEGEWLFNLQSVVMKAEEYGVFGVGNALRMAYDVMDAAANAMWGFSDSE